MENSVPSTDRAVVMGDGHAHPLYSPSSLITKGGINGEMVPGSQREEDLSPKHFSPPSKTTEANLTSQGRGESVETSFGEVS